MAFSITGINPYLPARFNPHTRTLHLATMNQPNAMNQPKHSHRTYLLHQGEPPGHRHVASVPLHFKALLLVPAVARVQYQVLDGHHPLTAKVLRTTMYIVYVLVFASRVDRHKEKKRKKSVRGNVRLCNRFRAMRDDRFVTFGCWVIIT